jgi:hypothetical protein
MSSERDSNDFELIDFLDVAKAFIAEEALDCSKIIVWLKPIEHDAPSSEFKRHLSSQSPGTGEWIRETARFIQWHSPETNGSICIKAVPGAGKSVVAAYMIDSLTR